MTSRTRRVGLAALLAAFAFLLVGPAALAQSEGDQQLVIRQIDGTDPKNVEVTIGWNGPRAELEELTVREEGRLARTDPPVPLARAGISRSLVIVLDRSSTMRGAPLAAAKEGLTSLVSSLGDDEPAALVTFDGDVDVAADLTTDHSAVRRAIDGVEAGTDESAMFDGVEEGASLFEARDTVQPNIVLVTDGFDDISTASRSQVLSDLSRSSANLFAVSVGTLQSDDADLLGQLVARAGGESVGAADAASVGPAFDRVQATLTNQYVVTFASTAEQGNTQVEVAAGGQTATKAFVPGSIARGSAALDPVEVGGSPLPDFFSTGTGKVLGIGAIFLAVALGVFAVASLMTKNESVLDNALNPYVEGWQAGEEDEEAAGFAQSALFQRAVEITEDFAERQGFLEKVERRLEQANLPLRAAEALFVYAAAVAVVGIMLLVLGGFFVGLLATVFLAMVPPATLNFLAKRRQKAFEAQLPDMLQLLSGSLRAGYSLMQGVEAVSQEVAEPMGKELRRVVTEARLGRELEESLDGVAARMESPDFEWAIMAIRIQREVGGNLAELLLTVGETMINRERMRREVAALTAEGKISAIMLGILPPAISAVMYVVNPNYMKVLFTESIGNIMLGAGALMMVVGFAWMMKTIKIEI